MAEQRRRPRRPHVLLRRCPVVRSPLGGELRNSLQQKRAFGCVFCLCRRQFTVQPGDDASPQFARRAATGAGVRMSFNCADNQLWLSTGVALPHLTRYGRPLMLLFDAPSSMNCSVVSAAFLASRYSNFRSRCTFASRALCHESLRLNSQADVCKTAIRASTSAGSGVAPGAASSSGEHSSGNSTASGLRAGNCERVRVVMLSKSAKQPHTFHRLAIRALLHDAIARSTPLKARRNCFCAAKIQPRFASGGICSNEDVLTFVMYAANVGSNGQSYFPPKTG